MENTKKGFWDRPENKTAVIFGIPLAGAGLYGLFIALPFIITLLSNTLYAIGLGVALLVVIYVLADKKNWALAWYFYRMIMKKITGAIIDIDPISIMESYIDVLKDYWDELTEQVESLKGETTNLENKIKLNTKKYQDHMGLARAAKKKGSNDALRINFRQAERLKQSNDKLIVMHTKLAKLYQYLVKMRKNTKFMITDFEFEVQTKKDELQAITKGHSAMRAAMKMIEGDQNKLDIFEEAAFKVAEEIAFKAGAIEDQIERSRDFMENMDLMDEMALEKGLEALEENMDSTLLEYQPKMPDLLDTFESDDHVFEPLFEGNSEFDEFKKELEI